MSENDSTPDTPDAEPDHSDATDVEPSDETPAPSDATDVDLTDAEGIACTLTEEEAARRRERVTDELFPHLEAIEANDDGVTLTFDGSEESLEPMMEFTRLEHQCCSFATFDLEITPGEESNRLDVTGEGSGAMFEQGLKPLVVEYDADLLA